MARHGTTPEMFYQRKLHISEDRVDLALFEGSDSSVVHENEEEVETAEGDPEDGEEVPEYDLSTNKDEEPEDGDSSILELDRRSTFLLGATTRFGRQVKIKDPIKSVITFFENCFANTTAQGAFFTSPRDK